MELTNEQLFERYEEKIVEAVNFDTIKYQGTHGKDPKGIGGWFFSLQSTTDNQTYKYEDETVQTKSMPYKAAKAEAVRMFKAKGFKPSSIWVMG